MIKHSKKATVLRDQGEDNALMLYHHMVKGRTTNVSFSVGQVN
jgi:hypothetical protein